jgi:hypothetical protein
MRTRLLGCAAAALLLAACTGTGGSGRAPSVSPTNPVDFPLSSDARIVTVRTLPRGHETIAASSANFDVLAGWIAHLDGAPPPGYAAVQNGATDGVDYAVFRRGKHRVLVLVFDPQRVEQRFGLVLGMVGRFASLPAFLRAPIDAQAKQRYGITLTQATRPDNPVGAALGALSTLRASGLRGIVLLDLHDA